MASMVGKMSNSTLRRPASRFTSFITGNLPYVPVPTTSWLHFQGMSSLTDNGVCPKVGTEFLGRLLLAFADLASVNHNVVLMRRAIDLQRAEKEIFELHHDLR
jgi:hypothetical protein